MKLINKPKLNKTRIIVIIILFIISASLTAAIVFGYSAAQQPIDPAIKAANLEKIKTESAKNRAKAAAEAAALAEKQFKSKHSITDPSSIWVIVNKQHQLSPASYVPADLQLSYGALISGIAKADFETMMAAANTQGAQPSVNSSYRSYDYQSNLYNNYIAGYGQTTTDTFSARPGYSEHQTGLAIDFGSKTNPNCGFDDCFATTTEGSWLATHAYEYGFILRYTSDKQSITGYKYEPWHYRYVGRELAGKMKEKSITTLEEFFNVSGGTTYL